MGGGALMPTQRLIYVDQDIASATAGTGTVGDPYSRWTYAIEQEHALSRDYVALDEEVVFVCSGQQRQVGSVWTAPDFGARLDATHRLILTAADSAKHNGIYDSSSFFTLWFVDGNVQMIGSSTRLVHWTFRDVQVRISGTSLTSGGFANSWGWYERVIFSREGRSAGTPTAGIAFTGTSADAYNLRLIACQFVGSWFRTASAVCTGSASVVVYNTTAVGCRNGFTLTQNSGTPVMRCINNRVEREASWGGTCYSISGADIVTATNMSDDTSSPQTGLRSLTGTFVNAGTGDYTPTGADPGIAAGTNLSADATRPFAFDLKNTAITTWMIGALNPASTGVRFRPYFITG